MREIEGGEKIEQVMGRWSPRDLAIIEDVDLQDDGGPAGATLVVKALFQPRARSWPDFDKEMYRVILVFEGVVDSRLEEVEGVVIQIMGFDIHFVGDGGVAGINYEIEDYEDGRIRFRCRGITVQSAELAVEGAP